MATIVGHNLLDPVRPQQFGRLAWLWTFLHVRGGIVMPLGTHQFVLFLLIPLAAVMGIGYAFGQVYLLDRSDRRKIAALLGLGLSLAFVVLRLTNLYRNPPVGLGGVSQGDWHFQPTMEKTLILFFDGEKYPPSLEYLLMTVGPSLILLARLDRERTPNCLSVILTFGRVPMFFYVLHLYLIHWLAVLVALFFHQPMRWLFHGAIFSATPPGYGHELEFVYLTWFIASLILYLPCRWFADLKQRRKEWWLTYL